MSVFQTMAIRIIKEQELIIGPIAWNEAKKVEGLNVDEVKHEIVMSNDSASTVDLLVKQYERLFGRASREVCREAVRDVIGEVPQEQLPAALK